MTIQIRWVGSEPKTYTAKELELAYKIYRPKEKRYEADQRWGPRLVDKAWSPSQPLTLFGAVSGIGATTYEQKAPSCGGQ